MRIIPSLTFTKISGGHLHTLLILKKKENSSRLIEIKKRDCCAIDRNRCNSALQNKTTVAPVWKIRHSRRTLLATYLIANSRNPRIHNGRRGTFSQILPEQNEDFDQKNLMDINNNVYRPFSHKDFPNQPSRQRTVR